jgi:hypothetical protein
MSMWIVSLLLLALASSQATANIIALNSGVKSFQDLCKVLGPFVPMRDIRSEQFCATSQLDSNQNKCALLDAMEAGLIKSYEQGGGGAGCRSQTPGVDKSITGVPYTDKAGLTSLSAVALSKNIYTTFLVVCPQQQGRLLY